MTLGKMILKRKKAVSPVIATILLIALTVTAAAIVYFVVVPLITNQNNQLVVTDYDFVLGADNQFEFTVENLLGDAVTINDVQITFLNGSATNAPTIQGFTDVVVASGASQSVTITVSPDFIDGETYIFEIFYEDGQSIEIQDTK